jgi:NTP pyrophosphatase (non-canonical NTP hydrolase)
MRKTVSKHPSGREFMVIDCDEYEVEVTKSTSEGYDEKITTPLLYKHKAKNFVQPSVSAYVDWDEPENGGKLTISIKDKFGCEMTFIHYEPSSIKFIFDSIAKVFGIYDRLYDPLVINKDLLEGVVKKFGASSQMDMVTEECAELIQAINKLKRRGGISFEGIIKPSEATDLKYSQLYWGACSEVADVKIMVAQAEIMLSKEAVALSVDRKLERLSKRFNNTKN